MRTTLQVNSGAANGRRIDLRSGQIARFGRTDWADFSFHDDDSMADVHFAVKCDPRGSVIRNLASDRETLVNGNSVDNSPLKHGDCITAGRTSFLVLTEDVMPGSAADDESENAIGDEEKVAANEMPPICQYLEFDDEVIALADQAADPDEVTQRLVDAEQLSCAVRWVAHHLGPSKSVWWGCRCLREMPAAESTGRNQIALEAAERWAIDPTEENRRLAEKAAESAKYEGPAATLAIAAFWSGGSIAPPDSPEVAPDDRLTGQAVAGALTMLSVAGREANPPERLRQFLELARDLEIPAATGQT